MTPFPVGLDVDGRACLVVGAGPVGARKAAGLLACGAVVTVVAPEISGAARSLAGVRIEERAYRPGEAADYWFVTTATDDAAVNRLVADDAIAAKVWVNAADDPANCTAILPAILRRGPITVAVSTSGTAPALASWIRDRIAEVIGPEFEAVAATLAERRAALHAQGRTTEGLDWQGQIDELVGGRA